MARGPFATRKSTHLAAPAMQNFGPGNQTRPKRFHQLINTNNGLFKVINLKSS
jgi:hypothetical protein